MRRDDRREVGALAGAGCLVLVLNLLWIAAVVAVVALVIRAVFL
jgi:hypothetical protein